MDCKHGAEECMGNIIELCAAHLYPEPRIYLGFVMCLTRDYSEIPDQDLVEDCALEHGIDFEKLNDCSSSDDGFGIGMLRNSVSRSRDVSYLSPCTPPLVHTEKHTDILAGWCLHKLYGSAGRRNILHTR